MTTNTTTSTAPFIPFADLPAGDPRALFGRAVATASAVIADVRPDQLELPTPCTELDVRHLLGHVGILLPRVAAIARGDDVFTVGPLDADTIADDAWAVRWAAGAREVDVLWRDDDLLTRVVELPWATLPGAGALAGYTNEVTVHTWDLATATGQTPAFDERVVAAAFDAIRRALPAGDRLAHFEQLSAAVASQAQLAPPFGAAVEIDDDAPLIDRLVAWNGRTPRR